MWFCIYVSISFQFDRSIYLLFLRLSCWPNIFFVLLLLLLLCSLILFRLHFSSFIPIFSQFTYYYHWFLLLILIELCCFCCGFVARKYFFFYCLFVFAVFFRICILYVLIEISFFTTLYLSREDAKRSAFATWKWTVWTADPTWMTAMCRTTRTSAAAAAALMTTTSRPT